MLVCMSTVSLVLTSCGSDDEPSNTQKQQFFVKGTMVYQDGFANGYPGIADPEGKEFKFYEGIYNEVKGIIKAQVWEISYTPEEKNQKFKEQKDLAEKRFTEMVKALDAVQKKLNETDKNEYKCHFSMVIELIAAGDYEIRSGQKTIEFKGNE